MGVSNRRRLLSVVLAFLLAFVVAQAGPVRVLFRVRPITRGVGVFYFQGTYLDRLAWGQAEAVAFSDADSWFDRYGSDDWGNHKKQSGEESGPLGCVPRAEPPGVLRVEVAIRDGSTEGGAG